MRPSTVIPGDAARPAAHSIAAAICLLLVLLHLPLACARVEEPTSPNGGAKSAAPSIPDDPPPESPPPESWFLRTGSWSEPGAYVSIQWIG